MTRITRALTALIVLLGLTGCFEFRIPQIGTIVPPKIEAGPYQFYLTSMTVNFDTMMTYLGDEFSLDDYREPYPDDPTGNADWFVLRDTFSTEFDLDMGMEADPVSHSISEKMEFVEFSTRTFSLSNPLTLADIIDFSLVPEGFTTPPIEDVAIPPDTSYVNFPMDRQRFASGTLEVTIQNDLACTLGDPLSVELYDSTTHNPILDPSNDPVGLYWTTPISSGSSSTETLSLAGVELPKHVMIIVNGVICGDGPETLTNNEATRNSSFSVSGQIKNLVGEFVEGDLDPQALGDTSYIDFGDDLNTTEISVQQAILDTCNIEITISNTSNISGKVLLDVMSLDISENAGLQHFTTDSMTIPAGGSNTYSFNLPYAAVQLDQDFEYRTYINIPGQYGQLADSDEFGVDFDFYGKDPGDPIRVESVDATFNNATYVFENMSIDAGIDDMIPEEFDDIELSQIELTLDILSDIDIPMYLEMDLIGKKNDSQDTIMLKINQQITGAGSDPQVVFDNAARLINFRPDSLIFSGNVRLNGAGNIPLTQQIAVDGIVGVPFQFEITSPLSFSPGYTSLNLDSLPAFLDDFSGALQARINNSFQFGVDFLVRAAYDTLLFDNPSTGLMVRTLANISVPAMDTTTQTLVLTKEDYDFLAMAPDSAWIDMDIYLTGRSDGQPTTFLSTDSVTLSLSIMAEGALDFSAFGPDTSNTEGGGE
jgi:hypothetical protein